jgi:hypothetical protein
VIISSISAAIKNVLKLCFKSDKIGGMCTFAEWKWLKLKKKCEMTAASLYANLISLALDLVPASYSYELLTINLRSIFGRARVIKSSP